MSVEFRLSVLDQSPIAEGSTGSDALRNTIDLARLADELGYHRYWVAEHHATPGLASASPEVLIGPIAAATSGSGSGAAASCCRTTARSRSPRTSASLSGLYPGRIDLGLGRAPGTDGMTMYALQRDRREAAPDDFPQQLAELLGYLSGNLPESFPFARLAATLPGLPERPDVWLLGSSPQSAIWAGELGLPYSFADFINPNGAELRGDLPPALRGHAASRSRRSSSVAVWTICAETDEEAQRLASSARMTFRLLREGKLIPVPPVEKALRFLESRGGLERQRHRSRPARGHRRPGDRARGARGGGAGVRRRGDDDRDDHA